MSSKRGYPIIGGPLAGELSRYEDMEDRVVAVRDRPGRDLFDPGIKKGDVLRKGGKFWQHADQYVAYNRANRWAKAPTMIWLHRDLLP